MAGSAKRERQLARERYLRQQERRSQAQAKRRRVQQITAVVVAVVVVIGGVVGLATLLGGNNGSTAATKPGSSASPSVSDSVSPSTSTSPAAGGCVYTKSGAPPSKVIEPPTYDKAKAASYRKPFTATLKTSLGDITIAMAADKAPCTTNSFRHLATAKYYDLTMCHRLTTQTIFVLQCGDPSGTGQGGPGYGFGVENAPADGKYPAGTVAMARTSDPNSNGSQFFLVYKDTDLPDPNGYTIFGTITKGLDVVQKVADAGTTETTGDGPPKQKLTIETVTIGKS